MPRVKTEPAMQLRLRASREPHQLGGYTAIGSDQCRRRARARGALAKAGFVIRAFRQRTGWARFPTPNGRRGNG
jgi:hypothetical protein